MGDPSLPNIPFYQYWYCVPGFLGFHPASSKRKSRMSPYRPLRKSENQGLDSTAVMGDTFFHPPTEAQMAVPSEVPVATTAPISEPVPLIPPGNIEFDTPPLIAPTNTSIVSPDFMPPDFTCQSCHALKLQKTSHLANTSIVSLDLLDPFSPPNNNRSWQGLLKVLYTCVGDLGVDEDDC